jgi:hypothetical protein
MVSWHTCISGRPGNSLLGKAPFCDANWYNEEREFGLPKMFFAGQEDLAAHDYPALFGLGAHPFLALTLFIAMFERDYAEPLAFQLEYAQRLSHYAMPYPDIAT